MYRLPAGLFEHAKKNGMHSVTWQPEKGIRMALVLVHVHSPIVEFVAVARSLREVETREYNLSIMAFIAWIACIILIAASALLTSINK
jgi:Mg2+/citrate symporter